MKIVNREQLVKLPKNTLFTRIDKNSLCPKNGRLCIKSEDICLEAWWEFDFTPDWDIDIYSCPEEEMEKKHIPFFSSCVKDVKERDSERFIVYSDEDIKQFISQLQDCIREEN